MRVLIAEPSRVVSLLLCKLFNAHGIETITASSASAALAALDSGIDLFCLAYELGDMNGIDLVTTARSKNVLQAQPVVLFASTHDDQMLAQARLAGVSQCFSKHQIADLEKFIAQFVARQTEQAAAHVLVVEDSLTNRKVIEAMLKKQGMAFSSVENGLEAVDRVMSSDRPTLVLMDCHMPVMDGYEATRCIRKWEGEGERQHVPIIALTASTYEEERRHCLAVGMDDFLSKPVNVKDLTAMLGKWLAPA